MADLAARGGNQGLGKVTRIGMLIPEFPGQTHAFFWREVQAMEEAGADIHLFSTRIPPASACPHAFRDAATARTTYLFPPSGAAAAKLILKPTHMAQTMRYITSLTETSRGVRARLMALIPSAMTLLAEAQSRGIAHVHIHSCANAAHLGSLANILGGLSYSLTLHGDLPVYGTDHAAKFARAAFVSAVTRPLSEAIRGVRADIPAPVIMMGVDADRFAPTARPDRNGPFQVVSVARLNPTKGHRFFLRAMAALRDRGGPEIHYRIAGDGPAKEAIIAEIETLSLGDRVTMLGSLSEDQVRDLLQGADALALTSIGQGEAAPVAVMEAMAAGLPVISSVIGGTPDMIDDGVDGLLVPQEDVAAIATALERLATDPDLATRLGTAARGTALAKFSYRANARALLAEIETAIGEKAHSLP